MRRNLTGCRMSASESAGGTIDQAEPVLSAVAEPAETKALPQQATNELGGGSVGWVFFFGILLPAIALVVELGSGMSASIYIDPIPSKLHIAMVAFVPLANLILMIGVQRNWVRGRWLLGVISGASIVIAALYALVYLPIAPIAVFGIVLLGLGFLALSPIFAFMGVLVAHKWLHQLRGAQTRAIAPGLVMGLLLGVLMVIFAEGPGLATRIGLNKMQSARAAERQEGVNLIRNFGSEEQLLYACYNLPGGMAMGLFEDKVLRWRDTDLARTAYYQVTGRTFNSEPLPYHAWRDGWRADPALGFFWDDGLGGDQVAAPVPGLSLASSRLDGLIEADAAVGYVEWTMVFANRSSEPREARAMVQLPAGGVVSRLTLWINGEEHEAAFGGSAQVRAAYQEVVVVQRRDPVLVTHAGPDRVMVQCFPVPPDGRMKVRMGITFPLEVELSGASRAAGESRAIATGQFRLPGYIDRNFEVRDDVTHVVWLDGDRPMHASTEELSAKTPPDGRHLLRGELSDDDLSHAASAVSVARAGHVKLAWTERTAGRGPNAAGGDAEGAKDAADAAGAQAAAEDVVVQLFERVETPRPTRVVVVVDGSASLAEHADAIAQALEHVPAEMDFALLIADDAPQWVTRVTKATPAALKAAADAVSDFDFEGGRDNSSALELAWDEAADGDSNAVVLWLHGPQPVVLREADYVIQRMQRQNHRPVIQSLQIVGGPNHIVRSLADRNSFRAMVRTGDIAAQLTNLFTEWRGAGERMIASRTIAPWASIKAEAGDAGDTVVHASQHLRRLWAFDEIRRLLVLGDQRSREQAVELGKANQLVTPITGAVVLETQVQYQRNGLQQGAPSNSPSVPEPSTAILFALGGGLLAARRSRRREES